MDLVVDDGSAADGRADDPPAVVGQQVQAQVAAATLALLASKSTSSRAFARRATIRGAANAFRLARPGCAAMELAMDRMTALLESLASEHSARMLAMRSASMKSMRSRASRVAVSRYVVWSIQV